MSGYYKIKKDDEVVITNDPKIINKARKKNIEPIHLGVLKEHHKEKARKNGVTIIEKDVKKK